MRDHDMSTDDATRLLTALADSSAAQAKLWTGGNKYVRLYLTERDDCFIYMDKDGDLIGTGRVWAPWEVAARKVGRKLYC